MMSFPMEAALTRVEPAKGSAAIRDFVSRIHGRPAYGRALEKGGSYAYA
jgi:glutathione S-transferase